MDKDKISIQILMELQSISKRLDGLEKRFEQNGLKEKHFEDDMGIPGISAKTIVDIIQIDE